ncbi:MAG: tail fiber domain-containing protein, partial [Cyclobacteriaceae bacterium]
MKNLFLSILAGTALLLSSSDLRAQDPTADRWSDSGSNTIIPTLSGSVGINVGTPVTGTKLDVRGGNIFQSPQTTAGGSSFPFQFIGIGESFGQCDIYGVRVQQPNSLTTAFPPPVNFANFGLKNQQDPNGRSGPFPLISWGGNIPNFYFEFDANNDGCGTPVAYFTRPSATVQLTVLGQVSATGYITSSDKRFKTDFRSVSNALETVKLMNPVNYRFDVNAFPGKNLPDRRSIGFNAQELQSLVPDAVFQDEEGYYGVNYDALIPVLTAAIQEQQSIIESLLSKVKDLSADRDRGANADPDGATGVIELFQNQPNPFNSETNIRLNLPRNVQNATLYIYDMNGKQIKELSLEERGQVSARIDGGELGAGMYIYALVADGEAVDSKRMILT